MNIRPISLFDLLPPDRVAPCELNQRGTSGMGAGWPGSPCLIEDELCLTCGAKTALGNRMVWQDGRPIPGTEVPAPEPLIDPDCRGGKCSSCVGGPCEHHCHKESDHA